MSDETWAELRLTNAAFACSHASRRAASRPTADVEEAVLVRGIDEEQDGALLPNNRTRDLGTNLRPMEVSCSAVVRIFPSRETLGSFGSKTPQSGRLLPEGAEQSTRPGR